MDRADHIRRVNRAIRTAETERFRPSPPRPTRGPGAPHQWLGVIRGTGANNEADHTDCRYWVAAAYPSNIDDDETSALTVAEFDSDSDPLIVTATNLAEIVGNTHNLSIGTPVMVSSAPDQGASPIDRFWFTSGGGGAGTYLEIVSAAGSGGAQAPFPYVYQVSRVGGGPETFNGHNYGEDNVDDEILQSYDVLQTGARVLGVWEADNNRYGFHAFVDFEEYDDCDVQP